MKLEDIQKMTIPNPMENRHSHCFPIEIAQKLMQVVWAAQDMVNHGEVSEKSDHAWMNNLDWALRELKKE